MEESKNRWLSKSFWLGIITSMVGLLGLFFPQLQEWYIENSELVLQIVNTIFIVLGLLGITVREATSVPIKNSLFGKDKK